MSKSRKNKPSIVSYKITRLDISATHPMAAQLPSDMFYVGLANKIYPTIQKTFSANTGFTSEDSKRMAITLACYVEDLVAGSGVWAAFTSLHNKKYGKRLPFYNGECGPFRYNDEKPSFQAVLFLLWYVANEINPNTVLNPNNPALRILAMSLMPELSKAYNDAPETPARPILTHPETSGIPLFYQIRNLCMWLCSSCYLTRIADIGNTIEKFEDFISAIIQNANGNDELLDYAIDSFIPMNAIIGPLGIPTYEWLAEIISLYHEPEEEEFIPILAAVKSRPYQYYRYETVGKHEAVLEDVNGEKLILSAESMPGECFPPDAAPGKSALLSLVLVDGVWLMNGIGLQGLPAEIYDECRETHNKNDKAHKETYNYLLKKFDKRRIGVCGSFEEYLKLACDNDSHEVSGDQEMLAAIREKGNLLYFLNSDGTVSILPGYGSGIKIKDNPYYDAESDSGLTLIFDHSLSTSEMRKYIIEHKLIPDAALSSAISDKAGKELFQKNIRFFNDYSERGSMPFLAEV